MRYLTVCHEPGQLPTEGFVWDNFRTTSIIVGWSFQTENPPEDKEI